MKITSRCWKRSKSDWVTFFSDHIWRPNSRRWFCNIQEGLFSCFDRSYALDTSFIALFCYKNCLSERISFTPSSYRSQSICTIILRECESTRILWNQRIGFGRRDMPNSSVWFGHLLQTWYLFDSFAKSAPQSFGKPMEKGAKMAKMYVLPI